MKIWTLVQSAALALGLSVGVAQAGTVDFTVANATVADASICLGCSLDAEIVPGLIGSSFTLAEGDTETLGFFDLTVEAGGFLAGGVYGVAATLDFNPPGGGISALGGGGILNVFFNISAGALVWVQDSFVVDFGNGGQYLVELEQGVDIVLGNARTINADVTLVASPVPLPASLLLLIGAGGALGAIRMRKGAMAAA